MLSPAHTTVSAGAKVSPLAFLSLSWAERKLVVRLARREVEARYRGTLLSMLWTLLLPLLTLAVYTFVFGVVFQARWNTPVSHKGDFALITYSGLLLFGLFSECLNRSPGLMLENVAYIKKVVFPLEILPMVSVLVALFNFAIGCGVLLCFYVAIRGVPPATALLLPLVVAPVLFLSVGVSYLLSSLGVFLRDIRQVVGVVTTLLMFLSPIFYPVSAIPEHFRPLVLLNPLTVVLEESKRLLFLEELPSEFGWWVLLAVTCGAWLFAWVSFWWFQRTKKAFADVV